MIINFIHVNTINWRKKSIQSQQKTFIRGQTEDLRRTTIEKNVTVAVQTRIASAN